MFSPRWSPDGRFLAALNFARKSTKLYLYNFQTEKWSPWIEDPDGISYPLWTADGKFLQYANLTVAADTTSFNQVKPGSSQIQHLFKVPNAHRYWTIGPWSSATPDGSLMYTQDASSENIYQLDVDFP